MILGVLDDILDRPRGQKIGLLVVAVFAVFLIDWQYVYGPRARQLTELRSQVAEKRAELQTRRTRVNGRADAERDVSDLRAELRRAQARLPDQREIADLLSSIAASGREAGLDIVLFRQKPELPHDFYAEVPVQMEMRGTYHDVAAFLDHVKRFDRIVNVADISLKKPRVEADRVMLDAACTVTTFRFLDEAERKRIGEEKKQKSGKGGGGKKT